MDRQKALQTLCENKDILEQIRELVGSAYRSFPFIRFEQGKIVVALALAKAIEMAETQQNKIVEVINGIDENTVEEEIRQRLNKDASAMYVAINFIRELIGYVGLGDLNEARRIMGKLNKLIKVAKRQIEELVAKFEGTLQ